MPVASQPARHMVALAVLLMLLSGIVVTLAVPIIANALGIALNVTMTREPAAGFAADESTPGPVPGGLTDAEIWWAASVVLSVVVLGGLAIVGRLLWRRNSQ